VEGYHEEIEKDDYKVHNEAMVSALKRRLVKNCQILHLGCRTGCNGDVNLEAIHTRQAQGKKPIYRKSITLRLTITTTLGVVQKDRLSC